MDRIEFTNTLDPSCSKGIILSDFSKVMSMYDIIAPHEKDLVQIEPLEDCLSLNLTLPSNELAKDIKNRFDRIEMCKYDSNFVVQTTLNNNVIQLSLNEVSG